MKRKMLLGMAAALWLAVGADAQEARPAGVPAGAEKVSATKYRHKDAQGKVWLYFLGPFGLSKVEEKEYERLEQGAAGSGAGERTTNVRAVAVEKELVRFEMPTPFGMQRWSKPRAELNESEKAALAAFEKRQSAARGKE